MQLHYNATEKFSYFYDIHFKITRVMIDNIILGHIGILGIYYNIQNTYISNHIIILTWLQLHSYTIITHINNLGYILWVNNMKAYHHLFDNASHIYKSNQFNKSFEIFQGPSGISHSFFQVKKTSFNKFSFGKSVKNIKSFWTFD